MFVAWFHIARNLSQPLSTALEVGQHQFGRDDFDVADRIKAAGDMDNVRIFETAHDLHQRIHLSNVA